jgi:L-ascorbate metabolism protein UlaG (beta-lactamase superfamily)
MDRSIARRAAAVRRERVQASPRWVDGAFRNIHPVLPELQRAPMPPLFDFFRNRPGKRPLAPLPALDPRPGWRAPPVTGLRATWLGHSTVLLEIDGMRLLTDPVWGARLSPVPLLAPRRFQPVPLEIDALPRLDAVLISHDHFDHLDRGSIEQLARRDGLPFVTALGVGAHLAAWGVPLARIHELDWWESVQLGALTISAAPSQHFSGRGIGRNATLWASFAVRGPRHALFFSGDTGLTTEYVQVRERLGPFDLVLLEEAASCRCTGEPSTWRCTPGTSPRSSCCNWRRATPCTCSCRGWASPWSPRTRKVWSRGGVQSLRWNGAPRRSGQFPSQSARSPMPP